MNMKKLTLGVATVVAFSLSGVASAVKPGTTADDGEDYNGNKAPSGKHYNLNLIGTDGTKNADVGDTNGHGHRIFVMLTGNTKILLQKTTEGDKFNFDVIDYDGTDGVAKFQLPNPDDNCDGTTDYSVYARAVTPQGSASMYSCVDDGNSQWCSAGEFTVTLAKGDKPQFSNVSRQLLYVTGLDGDGKKTREPLFRESNRDYFWEYDNTGLKLAQLRFYEIETDVTTYDDPNDPIACGTTTGPIPTP